MLGRRERDQYQKNVHDKCLDKKTFVVSRCSTIFCVERATQKVQVFSAFKFAKMIKNCENL